MLKQKKSDTLSDWTELKIKKKIIRSFYKALYFMYVYMGEHVCVKSFQSYLTLCIPMNHSPPDSYVHEILQETILEWIAMLFSRESSQPRDGTCISYIFCIGSIFFCLFVCFFYY